VNIEGRKVLVLGGYGLVGLAVCRELLARRPREIQIHSLRQSEAEEARAELAPEAGDTILSVSWGDIFGLAGKDDGEWTRAERIHAQLGKLTDENLVQFALYRLLVEGRPEVVIDSVNTATGIAYRDIFSAADRVEAEVAAGSVGTDTALDLLEALYMPRLIRHIQVLYRGMTDAGTRVYVKIGTSGTGGMGLNIPYTHSEERPSRVLLSKSAVAGAHSLLLFLMARTPGAPITKEIKPAAAIAWKKIAHGPIRRKGQPIWKVDARPQPLPTHFSTVDPAAARVREGEPLETVYIDTGENGIFSLEEFAMLTTAEQMEFVTPEEIARYLIFEIEGGNTGHDVINALDNAVLGPTYRAGLLRHWALERMNELEKQHHTHSVAFEMLGPPRNAKLLFEAHLLRLAFGTMAAVRVATAEEVAARLDRLVREQPEVANDVVCVGIPILLASGELLRPPRVIVPADAQGVELTAARLEGWVNDGWIDLRLENCARWIRRFQAIEDEMAAIPPDDSSSRFLRTRSFWEAAGTIQPGKVVGWILSAEEHGARFKR
jgi:hypothetical protein